MQETDNLATTVGRPCCALALELTYACNQACAYCYNPERSLPERAPPECALPEWAAPTAEQIIARLERLISAWQISQVTVTGGEPFSHPGLFAILGCLKVHGIRTQLISNGTLITSQRAQQLRSHSVASVQITLNGPTPTLHQAHVGRDSFEEAKSGALALLGEGVPVMGCIVVTHQNAGQVGAILEMWRQLGVQGVALSRFSPAGMSLGRMRDWLPRRQDLMTAFTQAKPYADAGFPIHCTVPVPACMIDTAEFSPIQFGQCAIGSVHQEFALGPDGALRLCTLHPGRLAGGRDVLDPSWNLADIPTSAEVLSYRPRIPAFCSSCSMAGTCMGGCGASQSFRDDGAPRALDPLLQQYFSDEPQSPSLARNLEGTRRGVES